MVLGLAALVLAGGSDLRAGAPAAPASYSPVTLGLRETLLPNGLKVLTREVRAAPVVSLGVWYRVGSRNEHTGITGVSHLLEHMLFKGTRKYRLGEISRLLYVNGANFNAGTFYDWTSYYETLAADRLEMALELEADRMVNSTILPEDLKAEMTVVRSELEGYENDPASLLFDSVAAAAFQAHPYQWPIIGFRTDVEAVSRDAVYRYYRQHYGPNNAVVVLVGDFNTAAALGLIRKHFGPILRIPAPTRVYTQEPSQRGELRVTLRRAGSLPMVLVAYKSPAGRSPDFYALDLLVRILGKGRSSRLYRSLVDGKIASEVETDAPSLKDPFLFTLSATAAPDVDADRLESALLAEVERVRETPVSDEELRRAKNQIEADFIFGNESVTSQGDLLGYWEMVDSWRYLNTYLDQIRKQTPADLQRAARKYFLADKRTVGRFLPTQQAKSAPPPGRAAARVEKPRPGDRPLPLPKPAPPADAGSSVIRFRLQNGIRVVVQEAPGNPTLSLHGSLPAGAAWDPRGKSGLAALTAEMLTRGTTRRSAAEFARLLEDVGAALTASSEDHHVEFRARARSRDFDRLMDLLAEMLRQPVFDGSELDRLRLQVLAALDQEKDDPEQVAARAFDRAVYPAGHPLRPGTLMEERKALESLSSEDVQRFYRQQYGPDNLILVLVGNVKAAAVKAALERRLGDWPRNPSALPPPRETLPAPSAPLHVRVPVPDKSETHVLWGHAGGLRRGDPDYYATHVMNMILGGGGSMNSRLGNEIRDRQGLCYDIYSYFDAGLTAGPFRVAVGTNPANAQRAINATLAEIRRLRERGVTQQELDEAVAFLTGYFPLRLETNAGRAEVLWLMEHYGLGSDYLQRYSGYYRAVTVQQVNAAAKKHLAPDRGVLAVAGPGM